MTTSNTGFRRASSSSPASGSSEICKPRNVGGETVKRGGVQCHGLVGAYCLRDRRDRRANLIAFLFQSVDTWHQRIKVGAARDRVDQPL